MCMQLPHRVCTRSIANSHCVYKEPSLPCLRLTAAAAAAVMVPPRTDHALSNPISA